MGPSREVQRSRLQRVIRFLMRHLTHLEIQGLENVPVSGGILITLNHLSYADSALLFMCPTREDITALITDKYKTHLVIRWFVDTAMGIWIDREKADFTAFRQAIDVLKAGHALGIAPEGTRSKQHCLAQGKPGAVFLALRTGVPVVPLGIWGSETIFSDLLHFRRPNMTARFGKPYVIPPLERENRDEAMARATDEMMCRIAALIPENYRGYYADHPRLKELLEEQSNQ